MTIGLQRNYNNGTNFDNLHTHTNLNRYEKITFNSCDRDHFPCCCTGGQGTGEFKYQYRITTTMGSQRLRSCRLLLSA